MKRQVTGIAAASSVLFGVASQAAEVTPAEVLELTVEDFDEIEEQEKGPAIYHVLTALHNYYTANSEERKATCIVDLYQQPISEGSETSVLMTHIVRGLGHCP